MGLTPPVSSKKKNYSFLFYDKLCQSDFRSRNALYCSTNFRSRNALYFQGVYLN